MKKLTSHDFCLIMDAVRMTMARYGIEEVDEMEKADAAAATRNYREAAERQDRAEYYKAQYEAMRDLLPIIEAERSARMNAEIAEAVSIF